MKTEKSTGTTLALAFLWAAAMLGSAILLHGTPYAEKVMALLLPLAVCSFLLVPGGRSSIAAEWRCLRERWLRNPIH